MAQAIIATKTVSGNTPKTRTLLEKAGQTFLTGVPVMVDVADGGVKEWTGNVADMIAGISGGDGSNLASTGKDAPSGLLPYAGLGTTLTLPNAVPNQPLAKMIPTGAPFNDGRIPVLVGNDDTVFEGSVKSDQTTAVTDVTKVYGLTKDADNRWYIDRTKVGANAVLTIVELHPLDGAALGGRVRFMFNAAALQVLG